MSFLSVSGLGGAPDAQTAALLQLQSSKKTDKKGKDLDTKKVRAAQKTSVSKQEKENLMLELLERARGPVNVSEDPFAEKASTPRVSAGAASGSAKQSSVAETRPGPTPPAAGSRISLRDTTPRAAVFNRKATPEETLRPAFSLTNTTPDALVLRPSLSFNANNPVIKDEDMLNQPVQTFVHPKLRRAVTDLLHIEKLTRIQRLSWSGMCDSTSDVMIRSETGSGKTLAYGLPLAHQLLTTCDQSPIKREEAGTLLAVICPTRELVQQVTDTFTLLLRHALFLTVGGIRGGESRHKEKARLRKGLPVLITTPGRLLDHLKSTSCFMVHRLQALVLDEADRLLDMGFERPIREMTEILQEKVEAYEKVKRVLVSATITDAVERLSHFALRPSVLRFGETEDCFSIPSTLHQHYVCVPTKHRLSALVSFLRSQLDAGAIRIVIFVSTADAAEFLYYLLSRLKNPFQKETVGGRETRRKTDTRRKMSVRKMTELANRGVRRFGDDNDSDDSGEGEAVVTFDETESDEDLDTPAEKEKIFGRGDDMLPAHIYKLHGNMAQVDRAAVFHAFKYGPHHGKSGKKDEEKQSSQEAKSLLFCTDVAARGLDMPDVHWIVHYDPPVDPASYIHRIGRTARIGRSGDSMLFLSPHEEGYASYLSQFLQQKSENEASQAPESDSGVMIKKKNYETLLYYLTKLDSSVERRNTMFHSAATLEHAINKLVMRAEHRHRWVRRGPQRAAGNGEDDGMESTENDGSDNLCRMALFAYQSYLRAYAAIPKEVRTKFFDSRLLHLGHVAQSFGIDKSPGEVQRQLQSYMKEDRQLGRDEKYRVRNATRDEPAEEGGEETVTPATSDRGQAVPLIGTSGNQQRKRQRVEVDNKDRYRSMLVQKQRKLTRDWVEKKRAEDGPRVKPLQFTEFDA